MVVDRNGEIRCKICRAKTKHLKNCPHSSANSSASASSAVNSNSSASSSVMSNSAAAPSTYSATRAGNGGDSEMDVVAADEAEVELFKGEPEQVDSFRHVEELWRKKMKNLPSFRQWRHTSSSKKIIHQLQEWPDMLFFQIMLQFMEF